MSKSHKAPSTSIIGSYPLGELITRGESLTLETLSEAFENIVIARESIKFAQKTITPLQISWDQAFFGISR